MARQTYRVDRTREGRDPYKNSLCEQAARRVVAWSAADNLGWADHDALNAAMTAPLDGTPFRVGDYTFTIAPETA